MRNCWREVSRDSPCAICGRSDWCSISVDGAWAVCRRVDNGNGVHRVDKSGGEFWLYGLKGKPTPQASDPDTRTGKSPERASPIVLDAVYAAILGYLELSSSHRQALRQRGLTDDQIHVRGYRTLPLRGRAKLARRLVDRFGPEVCRKIPGVHVKIDNNQSWWWSFAGPAGILIPVRDLERRVIALKVRRNDADDGPKYVFVSSNKRGGPGPGNPVHVPIFDGNTEIVRLTEGELKSDVATALSGILTIGMPGASAWRGALPILHALNAETVRLAFDADHRHNPNVMRALERTFRALSDETLS